MNKTTTEDQTRLTPAEAIQKFQTLVEEAVPPPSRRHVLASIRTHYTEATKKLGPRFALVVVECGVREHAHLAREDRRDDFAKLAGEIASAARASTVKAT